MDIVIVFSILVSFIRAMTLANNSFNHVIDLLLIESVMI